MTEAQEPRDRYEEAVALLEKTRRELEAKIEEVEQIKTALHIANGWYELTKVQIPATAYDLRTHIDDLLVGPVTAFAMSTPPLGWLVANGEAVCRETYWKLFQQISTTFGEGDGSATFNLPDLRGLMIRGWANQSKHDSKRKFGSYQADQMQSHTHKDSGHTHTGEMGQSGEHNHDSNIAAAGDHTHSGKSDHDGNHTHSIEISEPGDWWFSCWKEGGTSWLKQSGGKYAELGFKAPLTYAGNHYHILHINSAGNHSHNLIIDSAGNHSHTVSINTAYSSLGEPASFDNSLIRSGSETRSKNLALMYCIFAGQ